MKKEVETLSKHQNGNDFIADVSNCKRLDTKDKRSKNNETAQLGIAAVSGSFLFDIALLEKAIIKQPEYVMGVDTYDKDALAYCFGRKVDGVFEIMLTKTMRDENEFKQEVENLAKYFNADVFRSGD